MLCWTKLMLSSNANCRDLSFAGGYSNRFFLIKYDHIIKNNHNNNELHMFYIGYEEYRQAAFGVL